MNYNFIDFTKIGLSSCRHVSVKCSVSFPHIDMGWSAECDFGISWSYSLFAVLFVCFVALRPKSTAMVIAGRSVHLTTLFPGQA